MEAAPASQADADRSAWRRTIGFLAIAETLVWAGTYYLFPALLLHFERDLGWPKTELALAFTLALVLAAAAAPTAGRIIDRGHGRVLLTGSTCAAALLLLALAEVETRAGFYAVWLGLGLVMAGCLYEPCFAYLTRMLGTEARRAITIITLVAGFAGTVSFPVANAVAGAFGWRASALTFAVLIGAIAAPLMWFSGPGDATPAAARVSGPDRARPAPLRSPVFWLLAGAFTSIALTHGILITHLLPLLAERGIEAGLAVLAVSLIGPMQVAGRLGMLAIERHVRIGTICALSFLFMITGVLTLSGAGAAIALVLLAIVLQGTGYGVTSITRPALTASYLGRTGFGVTSGMLATAFWGATAAAPTLAALIWAGGGYDLVLGVCAGALALGFASLMVASRLASPE